jgi:hypothetical protein
MYLVVDQDNNKRINLMKQTVQEHRQELSERTIAIETQLVNIYHDIKEIKELLKIQNGRVRKNESNISYIFGVGAVITFLLTVLGLL